MQTTTELAPLGAAPAALSAPSAMLLHDPERVMAVANILQRFVDEKKLASTIQGKRFAQCEAWQFAGQMLGLFPRLLTCERVADTPDGIIGYEAVVVIEDANGRERARGHAYCDNSDKDKKGYARYAVMSMVQTRAVGKAFRLLISYLMKAAGFEGTPAEEMENEAGTGAVVENGTDHAMNLYAAGTAEELHAAWVAVPPRFSRALLPVKDAAKVALGLATAPPPATSSRAPKLATDAQRSLLTNLAKSHHLDAERDGLLQEMDFEGLTMDRISVMIEGANQRIQTGNKAERAAPKELEATPA